MRDRQEPFHQGHPPVEVLFHIGVVNLEVDGLLFDGRRVLVGEQAEVGANPVPEAGQLAREVEPPARIAPSKEDHQGRGGSEAAHQPAGRVPSCLYNVTGFVEDNRVGDRLAGPRDEGENDGDGNDPEKAEEGCQPVQFLRIVDLQTSSVVSIISHWVLSFAYIWHLEYGEKCLFLL